MTATAITAERALSSQRHRCRKCLRIQVGGCYCGLCGGTLFDRLETLAAPQLALDEPAVIPPALPVPPRDAPARLYRLPRPKNEPNPVELVDRAPEAKFIAPEAFELDHALSHAKRVSFADVTREPVERQIVGWGGFDHVFGGGAPRRRFVLLGGIRGTGKTALMLAAAAAALRHSPRSVLYVAAENQDAGELATMIPSELENHRIEVCRTRKVDDLMHHALELAPLFLVIDSIQMLENVEPKELTLLLSKTARALDCTIFALSQMTADGKMRGSEVYRQLCDTVAMNERVDEQGELAPRGARVRLSIADGKNRGGPIDRFAFFRFDDAGVLRPELDEEERTS